jgi:hypothetical protein
MPPFRHSLAAGLRGCGLGGTSLVLLSCSETALSCPAYLSLLGLRPAQNRSNYHEFEGRFISAEQVKVGRFARRSVK